MTTYKVTEAHSGTSNTEIAKAKRHYNKMKKSGQVWDKDYGEPVNIQFDDTNYKITARYFNIVGQEICPPCGINH